MVKKVFDRRYVPALVAATLLGGLINAWSVLLAFFNPAFRGLLPYGGSEEAMYLIRTQEALLHPFTTVTNGVWSGQSAPLGLQSAGIEQLIGALLWWTHLPAPWVVFVLHVLIAPLSIPLAAALARRVGARKPLALLCGAALFWFFVYCRRLFHPGFSLPLVLATLLLLWRWYEKPSARRAVLLGVPLGFAVGVYLWAWTFLWSATGLLLVGVIGDRKLTQRKALLRSLPWVMLAALIAAAPAVKDLMMARAQLFFAQASVRAGLVHTHLPESPARSVVTVVLAVLALWIFRKKEERRAQLPLLCVLGALAVAYNQQLVHGVVLSFSSHYIHYVSVAAALLILAILARKKRTLIGIGTCLLCAALLVLNGKDMGGRLIAFEPPPADAMRMQHLAPALDALRGMPQTVFLSDKNTADVIASYTQQDVAFTEYSGFLLVSDKEYVERACLATLFAPLPTDYKTLVVHAEERLRVLRGQEPRAQYDSHVVEANIACAALRADPAAALKRYGVTHVLWNEAEQPGWKLPVFLKQTAKGDSWSIWQVQS
ncbi:MAG TPA: hypothetical protein PKV72_01570 [Candidatus Peribacteria bacterium]|nr:hypothetical protein [Candidatus Peribacteria bacterium]